METELFFVLLFFGLYFFVTFRYWYVTFPLMVVVLLGTYVYDTPGRLEKHKVDISELIVQGGEVGWSVAYRVTNHSQKYAVSNLYFMCDGSKKTLPEVHDLFEGEHVGILPINLVDAASAESISYCRPVFKMRRLG